jgi:hypothetical protein
MKFFLRSVAGLSLALVALTARASLIPIDGGRIVQDTANDTQWVSDANLFKTLANAGGDPAAFVHEVIAAAGGVIDDTPCQWDTPTYSGHYSLTVADFSPGTGHLNWYGAQAFIAYLNSIRYLGHADWRQPVTVVSFDYDGFTLTGTAPGDILPASGELSELFYTELGARYANGDYLNSVNGYAALFHNLEDSYNYATEGSADPGTAGLFLFGFTANVPKIGGNKDAAFAWPVRYGRASVTELIDAVAKRIPPADDGHDSLVAAEKRLRQSCEDLGKVLEQEPQSKHPLLDADVKSIGKLIGCP